MCFFGIGLYTVSWGMLGLCLLLAGKEVIPLYAIMQKTFDLFVFAISKNGNP
jgi:hypothetical protein